MAFDPVLLEILNNRVAAIADEMKTALKRASRSMFVKEAEDFGVGLIGLDGHIFGYPPTASTQFVIDSDASATLALVPDLEPGDVIVANCPYRTEGFATHLPDIQMLKPYFDGDRIIAYGWCFCHFTDIGGRVPSSISPTNTELYQEGIIIPPMKVVRRGELNRDFVTIFSANCRIPEVNMGDIHAMIGALNIGARRIGEVVERYDADTLVAAQGALQDYAAAKARAVLRMIPDGAYEFWDFMDDDAVSAVPVRLRVRMTVEDGEVDLDVTETDPQVAGAYNVPTLGKRNYWFTMRLTNFLLTHDPTIAQNAGMYRHISVTSPEGTVMNAEFPDPVGIRQATARRINDAVVGALLNAAPDKMVTPSCGSGAPFALAEYDAVGAKRDVKVIEPLRGGMGALMGRDGVDVRDVTNTNMSNHPVEQVETEAAVIIREWDVRPDSGGAGCWRGGVGQRLTVEFLRDGGIILARGMDRLRFPAFGVHGAKPAEMFRAILNVSQESERDVGKLDAQPVDRGDTITFLTPGASGFGDPFEREPERVLRDVVEGFVTLDGARQDYGVAIEEGAVDEVATRRLRTSRVRDNRHAQFDFGPDREAWEAVFDDDTMRRLNRGLHALPRSVRKDVRRRLFETAVPDLPKPGSGSIADALADPDAVRARLDAAMEAAFGAVADREAAQ